MSSALPEVTRVYQNHHLDSTRWELFEPRDDDIIVTTAYKAGTTWTQQILHSLLRGSPGEDTALHTVSPWVDARFHGPKDALKDKLEALPDRRFLKSHLPLDGLPYFPEVRYIVVGRDPRDVFMSLWNHFHNYTEVAYGLVNGAGLVGDPLPPIPETPQALFRQWITRGWFPWEREGWPFWSNMAHTQSYWEHRALPNLLFLHYNDMLDDLDAAVRRIAEFTAIPASEAEIARAVEDTTFANVKKKADADAQRSATGNPGFFRGGASAFFFKGTNGRWRDVLEADDLALYEHTRARVLSPDCARWLEQGGPV